MTLQHLTGKTSVFEHSVDMGVLLSRIRASGFRKNDPDCPYVVSVIKKGKI